MFGKISQTGHQSIQEQTVHCFHNCGLCKTIGREYGLLPRVLLNSDIALLQEMLGCIDASYTQSIERQFLAASCFQLPQSDELPASFRYSAAVTLLFAQHKLRDNIRDSKGPLKVLPKAFEAALGSGFSRARGVLNEMAFPIDAFDAQVERCIELERIEGSTPLPLEARSEAHGQLCGTVARHACSVVNKSHISDAAYEFGVAFGSMVYICDAFEDFRDDVRSGAFNPLVALHGPTFSNEVRIDALSSVRRNLEKMNALSEKFSGEAGTGHITRRIAINVDRVFQTQSTRTGWSLAENPIANRYRAFTSQTQLQLALISDQGLTSVQTTRGRMSAILRTMLSTFVFACYASPVPLANRVPIDPALLGTWKACDEQTKNGLSGPHDTVFQRLNDNEYLMITSQSDTAGKATTSTTVVYLSRVGNKLFLNYPVKNGQDLRYAFIEVELRNQILELRFMDDALFKRSDNNAPLVFDSSQDLTNYVASIVNDEKLLNKPSQLCR